MPFFFCRERRLTGKNDGGGKDLQREFVEIPSVHCSTVNVLQNSKITPSEGIRCFSHACRLPSDVVILFYQPETDTLVITQVMPQHISYQIASIKGMWIQKSYSKSLFG